MSGNFLVSSGPLLEILSKEVQNCLDVYPTVAMTRENIEKFFGKLQKLFNGGYRPVRFQTVKLNSCILGFCECIMIFIKDSTDIKEKDHFYNMDRWMSILDNLGCSESIRNKFIFFKPILLNPVLDDLPIWFYKLFMIHLNRVFETTNELSAFHKDDLKSLYKTASKWVKLIMTCGDYEFQTILVRNIITLCEKPHIEYIFKHEVRNTGDIFKMFLVVYSQKDYVNDLQVFLSRINDNFNKVHSIPCLKVTLQEKVIPPLKGMNGDVTWMHINYGVRSFSFSCDQDSLRSLPGSDLYQNVFEFVAVHFEDVDQICLLINNDSKADNSAVGIFVLKLSGKCSCRFNSSREIVSLIKNIVVTVPNGLHLEFLKEELVKLFGKKFKEEIQTPIKRAKWLGKKHSRSNFSLQNLSFSTENRRRMNKRTDSTTSSHGSFITPNFKFNNSFALDNKENISEGSKELSNTGMHSNSNNMSSSSSNCLMVESININVNEIKEDKRVITDSIIASHSTKQSFKAKAEKERYADITKRNSLLLKNSDSGISTIKTEEDMEIPSNYRFGEYNSSSILEKNRDSIIGFSNTKLSTFPHLNISSKETISQSKTESMNSSLISTTSSVSKTMSKAKRYGLDLDLSLAPSASKESLVKDKKILTLPEITIKCKSIISSGISNNSLESLPTNLPKIKNKEQTESALNKKLKISDSYTFPNTPVENTELISEEVFDDEIVKDEENKIENSEILNDGQIVEESEYYSIVTDSASTEENTESNYSEAFSLYLERNNALVQLFNMNTEDIKNVEIVNMKKNEFEGDEIDELLTVDNSSSNSAELKKFPEFDHKQETTNEEYKNNNFLFGQQESEYYSCDPDIISVKDNEVCDEDMKICNSATPDLNLNVGSNESITTLQQVNSSEESEYISCASDDHGADQLSEPSETPDRDDILANCTNIVSPHVDSKNVNMNISTIHGNELIQRDHSYTLRNTKEQILVEEEIQKNDNLMITDNYQRSKYKNVNEKISSPSNIRLSTETVKIENWDFPDNIPKEIIPYIGNLHTNEDQENNDDNISVISISSTEEIDSDVESSNRSTKAIDVQDEKKLFSETVRNDQIKNKSFTEKAIEYNQLEDMVKTMKDMKKLQIATPDLNFTLGSNANNATPTVSTKRHQKISETHSFEELVKIRDSYTRKHIREQLIKNKESPNLKLTVQQINFSEESENLSLTNQLSERSETPDRDFILASCANIVSPHVQSENVNTKTHENEIIERNHSYTLRNTKGHVSLFTPQTEGSISSAKLDNENKHSYFPAEIEITTQYDDISKSDADMEKTQITEVIESIENDHCYYFNQTKHEVENKNDEDNVINKSNDSFGSIYKLSTHGSKEVNEFSMDQLDFGLSQFADVAILFNQIDSQQKFDQMVENDVVKSDVPLTYLLNRHQQILDKSNTSMEDLENSFKLSNCKSMEHVSSDKQRTFPNAHFAQNKIKILSNIRIAPPLNVRINDPDNNFLLNKFITNVDGKVLQDQSNLIDNEIFEISDCQTDYIPKVQNTRGLPTKKFLLNKFYTSLKESTKSTCNTNISTETDFEMLIPRNDESNPEELELSFKILSPQKSLFDVISAKERKIPKAGYFEEFLSFVSNKSSQDSKRSDFEKLKVQKKRIDDYEEFALTLQSKKRLPDEADTRNPEKRRKLLEDVRLSDKLHQAKENSFEVLTSKKLPLRTFNKHKRSTPLVQLTQAIQKSKESDREMIETDNGEPDHLTEFVSIRKASEKSFAISKLERRNKKIDEDVNFIKKYEAPQLDRGEKVQSVSRKQKFKENNYEKLDVINEEEFGLPTKSPIVGGSDLNQNIDFDWDDFKIGKENNDRLYNILNHPRRAYTICDKTGEALKFGKPIRCKEEKVQNDEEFYKVADSIYGFDAMLFALRSYLKTCDSTKNKKRKPKKKKITKMKLFVPMKAKSKSKKKKFEKRL